MIRLDAVQEGFPVENNPWMNEQVFGGSPCDINGSGWKPVQQASATHTPNPAPSFAKRGPRLTTGLTTLAIDCAAWLRPRLRPCVDGEAYRLMRATSAVSARE